MSEKRLVVIRRSTAYLPLLFVALPVVAAACFMAIVSLSGWLKVGPFRAAPPISLSDAVVDGDAAAALLWIRSGADPDGLYPLTPGHMGSREPRLVRPLEAAAIVGDTYMIELVQRHGGTLPADDVQRVACDLAARGKDEEFRLIAGELWDPGTCAGQGDPQ
ncbi:MAG: hypothetical protein ABL971_01230 [Vicinamibacterales bacterium]